jgi:NADH:ubiquinone oxidoreductase subunit 3 (subunit A)
VSGVLRAFAAGFVVMTVTVGVIAIAIGAGRARSPFESTAPQRVPFLGGSQPETHAWSRFHVRYYPMTLVFLAFEMEMMFMYPWAVVFVREGVTALADMGVFLGLLSLGILYAWREGAFRWQ